MNPAQEIAEALREALASLEEQIAEREKQPMTALGYTRSVVRKGDQALARWEAAMKEGRVTDLDRAWRAVDALGGTWPDEPEDQLRAGYQRGYDEALTEACAAIEKLGGRDVPGADASAPEREGDEIEQVAAWMLERSYATGHGDTVDDLLTELESQIKERTLSPPDPDGWIEWKGGECPIETETLVDVIVRVDHRHYSREAGTWHWNLNTVGGQIIAYRPSQPHRAR